MFTSARESCENHVKMNLAPSVDCLPAMATITVTSSLVKCEGRLDFALIVQRATNTGRGVSACQICQRHPNLHIFRGTTNIFLLCKEESLA